MNSEDPIAVAWRDYLFGLVGIFIVMYAVAILWVNEPKDSQVQPPGELIVTMFWDQGPYDIDLWMNGPGEPKPVGFSNRQGVVWNLLRDDLGTDSDVLPLNYENAYSRGAPDGKYSINVYYYKGSAPVTIRIKLERSYNGSISEVASTSFVLNKTSDWRTFVNFDIENGVIDNVNHVQKAMF